MLNAEFRAVHDIVLLVSSPLQRGTNPALPELDKLNVKTLELAFKSPSHDLNYSCNVPLFCQVIAS